MQRDPVPGGRDTLRRARPGGAAGLSRRNRLGLVLAFLLGVADVASTSLAARPTAPGEAGPPDQVLYLGGVIGLLTIGGAAYAWRRSTGGALRLTAVTRILSLALAVPAFFEEDVPAPFVAGTTVALLLTLLSVALLMDRR